MIQINEINYNLFRNELHSKHYESPSIIDKTSKTFQLNSDGFLEVSKK